jgi:outer membrane biosynthesis protein TonB
VLRNSRAISLHMGCVAGLILMASCSHSGPAADQNAPVVIRWPEANLRAKATSIVEPTYPLGSHACGVAVAELELAPDGSVTESTVLEAPDPRAQAAVADAVSKWRFAVIEPADKEQAVRYRGKLTFYFVPAPGTEGGTAFYADRAPNVAECIDRQIAAPVVRASQ